MNEKERITTDELLERLRVKKKYKYLIVYLSEKSGYGNAFMTTDTPYNTTYAVSELMEYLQKEYCNGENTLILNIIPLEVIEEERTDGE